jgi:hypothetical protein
MQTQARLSLAQAPPISVPLRYFLTAPLFGIFAACLFIGYGPDAATSRWSPLLLGATHLMTLGFITMAMFGAMSQMVPVLAGSPLPRPRLVSAVAHALLTVGALALSGGLLLDNRILIGLGMPVLGIGLFTFIAVAGFCLFRAQARSATVSGMRLAVISLAVAVAIGLRIAAEHVWNLQPQILSICTDIHVAWGLLGWVTTLVISAAYEVVPMFQITPAYPLWMQRWLTRSILGLLVLWSLAYAVPFLPDLPIQMRLANLLAGLLALGLVLFACATLYLQHKRRRRLSDVTLQFWRTALLSLLACVYIWLAIQTFAPLQDAHGPTILLGALFITGFVVSVITGMMYKIVPFLIWLHLQGQGVARRIPLPNMKEIIPDQRARRQLRLHIASVLLLVCAALMPVWFLRLAAFTFALSFLHLAFNLYGALRIYRKVCIRLVAAG